MTHQHQLTHINAKDVDLIHEPIEVDEYFVVLYGLGSVQLLGQDGTVLQSQQLASGSLVRLYEGMITRWQIEQTLRKVHFTPTDEE